MISSQKEVNEMKRDYEDIEKQTLADIAGNDFPRLYRIIVDYIISGLENYWWAYSNDLF